MSCNGVGVAWVGSRGPPKPNNPIRRRAARCPWWREPYGCRSSQGVGVGACDGAAGDFGVVGAGVGVFRRGVGGGGCVAGAFVGGCAVGVCCGAGRICGCAVGICGGVAGCGVGLAGAAGVFDTAVESGFTMGDWGCVVGGDGCVAGGSVGTAGVCSEDAFGGVEAFGSAGGGGGAVVRAIFSSSYQTKPETSCSDAERASRSRRSSWARQSLSGTDDVKADGRPTAARRR